MNIKYYLAGAGILCVLVSGVLVSANAFSIKELLGFDDDEATLTAEKEAKQAEPGADWGEQLGADSAPLSIDTLKQILANLNQGQRTVLLQDEERFKQFVGQEARNKSVFAAAVANNLHKDPNAVFLMQRGAETVLREAYLNHLLNSKIPNDFPSDEQVREYYEKNKDQFVIGERVHVWQIFFSTEERDENEIKAIKKKADDLAKQIAAGKVNFADAVKTHSEHEQSRTNAGYVGLPKVTELKPEVRDVIVGLRPGRVSKAIESDTGIHIFKRGDKVAEQDVELEQISGQVRDLLRKQATTQLLDAIFQQAEETYPGGISDEQIEQWRVQLSQES